ncbi:MAG: cystathionine gamma-synthase family protein [Proteobacteria bacterium]|nr:cystathionine gamma-synthase family protein [Pseudomonadota bacterium]MBI3496941.1 cystathionine gamma-synthase family protein [Pseudomonadota bacterium]
MKTTRYKDRTLNNHPLHPETLMMGYGYSPSLSEGALKPPIFLTSTFVFESAQQGKDFFDLTAGRRRPREGEKSGLVYSRFNNPNFEILEDRLAVWDDAERAAVFASGMAAIATMMLAFLRPGDTVLHSRPLYGGTETLIRNQLTQFGITPVGFTDGTDKRKMAEAAEEARGIGRVGLIMLETPANPTNGLVDLKAMAAIADSLGKKQRHRPPVAVDNTLLGPMYQKPLEHGADLAIYSLTKYAGGHSDLVAGGICGSEELMRKIVMLRGALGTQLDPHSCWMLLRSLETLSIRTERANENARKVADYLEGHRKIAAVHYLGRLDAADPRKAIFDRQCTAPGSTFSFEVNGGEKEAFQLLDRLRIMKLAVSLGGTETLISHPASTTHSGVAKELREEIGLSDATIRISVGIENPEDLIKDLEQALAGG